MTTFVGMQLDFVDAITELVELEWDALEGYKEAIKHLVNINYSKKLEAFKLDHERHILALNPIILKHGGDAVEGPSVKQWLTKGKIILANLIDDNAILAAMITNEEDTNIAYLRMTQHKEKWADISNILDRYYEDEKRHKEWFISNIIN